LNIRKFRENMQLSVLISSQNALLCRENTTERRKPRFSIFACSSTKPLPSISFLRIHDALSDMLCGL